MGYEPKEGLAALHELDELDGIGKLAKEDGAGQPLLVRKDEGGGSPKELAA